MGTRNLTVIIKDGQIRLSQYGQWDGYFSWTGVKFLEFVRNNLKGRNKKQHKYLMEKFCEKVNILKEVDKSYYDDLIKLSDKYDTVSSNTSGFAIPFKILLPQFSRDTGVEILNVIQSLTPYEFQGYDKDDKPITKYYFPVTLCKDSGWIEFANIIDLDNEMIYMLTDHEFNSEKLGTTLLIDDTYNGLNCWFKCEISKVPSVKEVEKYKNSIGLDYWQDSFGKWISN